jgi:hypothetical protein
VGTKRGPGGRFAPAGAEGGADDDDMPLLDLEIAPVDELPADIRPPELEPEPPPPAGDEPPDATLAITLARGIDETVGLLFGAEYRGEPDQVTAVGEAADPVIRRALTLVHAGQLAESTVPAPVRELVVLAARVWVAWGDALVVTFQRQVAELRAAREVDGGTTDRPAGPGDRGDGRSGRVNGHDHGVPAGAPAAAADNQGAGEGGPTGTPSGAFAQLLALDTGARRGRARGG